tara:strand:- start:1077 stop:1652 length:576 start_codon:yes stop_codon:yes gene_type:complete
MFLICGLGNPGEKYTGTRHNIGFQIIDELLTNYKFIKIKKDKKKELFKGYIGDEQCILMKPLSFVNLSGIPILEVMNFYKINISKLYVIHDDLDLSLSKIKLKVGGGNAGHNGLVSIDESIGNNYCRIRIGIGHPGNKELVPKYVLKKFLKKEKIIINNKIDKLIEFFDLIFSNHNLFLTKIAEQENFNGL